MRRSRSDRVVTFRTAGMPQEDRRRLWHLLLDVAMAHGADGFSIQPDTTLASSTTPADLGTLMLHLGSLRPRWRWRVRPRAWPLDDASQRWLRDLGTSMYQIHLWGGRRWVLQTDLWGRIMQLVVPLEEWERLGDMMKIEFGDRLDRSVQTWRSLEPREAGGWAVPRGTRWALAFATALLAGPAIGLLAGWRDGVGAGLSLGLGVLLALPQHEPSASARLMVRSGSLTDRSFAARARLASTVGPFGVLLTFVAAIGIALSDPGSDVTRVWWPLWCSGRR